jgi:hypothetical protein
VQGIEQIFNCSFYIYTLNNIPDIIFVCFFFVSTPSMFQKIWDIEAMCNKTSQQILDSLGPLSLVSHPLDIYHFRSGFVLDTEDYPQRPGSRLQKLH